MKTYRFSSVSAWAAAVLLAGFLLAAGRPAAGQTSTSRQVGGATITVESSSRKLAQELAPQARDIQQRFDESRRALRTVRGPGGEPAYLRQEVTGLIHHTGEDLGQAIERVGESDLGPLRAWSDEQLRRIQEEVTAPPARAVAGATPQQDTIAAEKSNRLLDQVGAVVGRIFLLAERDDLEVTLWVGSTPAQQATFRFWPQGQVQGSRQTPTTMQTNGKRDHVLRGLYSYRAALANGPATQSIESFNSAGTPAARLASEPLDLVTGSSFFCCQFSERSCRQVASENECPP